MTPKQYELLSKLTDEEREAIIAAISEWITIATEEGYEPIRSWSGAKMEVIHSALLRRLLSGKRAYRERPPLKNSYPDYEAMEGKELR